MGRWLARGKQGHIMDGNSHMLRCVGLFKACDRMSEQGYFQGGWYIVANLSGRPGGLSLIQSPNLSRASSEKHALSSGRGDGIRDVEIGQGPGLWEQAPSDAREPSGLSPVRQS